MEWVQLCLVTLLSIGWAGAASSQTSEVKEPTTFPSTCLVGLPSTPMPETGWPVFVLMHGYGTNKEDFSALVDVVKERGAVAVSVDAPDVLGPGRRKWGSVLPETHRYLQEQIAFLYKDERFDTRRIHVGGFSQGGIRSLLLVAYYPEIYGGAYSLAPAGGDLPEKPAEGTGPHPLFLVWGTADNPGVLSSAARAQEFWNEWSQPLDARTHGGGHQFPSDWVEVTNEAVDWIVTAFQ